MEVYIMTDYRQPQVQEFAETLKYNLGYDSHLIFIQPEHINQESIESLADDMVNPEARSTYQMISAWDGVHAVYVPQELVDHYLTDGILRALEEKILTDSLTSEDPVLLEPVVYQPWVDCTNGIQLIMLYVGEDYGNGVYI